MGIRPEDLNEGQNLWQEIERVFDPDRGGVTFPPDFRRVYAGVENEVRSGNIHSILLDGRGRAWATGANNAGQLCLGDTLDRMIPQKIPIKNVVDVAIGGEHTLLLLEDGTVYGCGSNKLGQIGLGDLIRDVSTPTQLFLLPSPATSVSAGKDHSLIMTSRDILVMGSNQYKQLCGKYMFQCVTFKYILRYGTAVRFVFYTHIICHTLIIFYSLIYSEHTRPECLHSSNIGSR